MEYCASVARLAGRIYDNHSDFERDTMVLVDCALCAVGEWGLKPGSPRSLKYMMGNISYFSEAKDLMWDEPISVCVDDLVHYSDHIAFRQTMCVFESLYLPEKRLEKVITITDDRDKVM